MVDDSAMALALSAGLVVHYFTRLLVTTALPALLFALVSRDMTWWNNMVQWWGDWPHWLLFVVLTNGLHDVLYFGVCGVAMGGNHALPCVVFLCDSDSHPLPTSCARQVSTA